jgi:lysophospholipase L1-like esterase
LAGRSIAQVIFCIVTLLYGSADSFASSERPPSRWTGTWAVAPQRGTLDARERGSLGEFAQKTLRQSFRVSVGGSKVRIRLSNVFGQEPLTIGDVHIALAASNRAIFINSDKTMTFHGPGSVTIPAGESIISDPVKLIVKPLSDVTVSMYVPKAVEGDHVTRHTQANQDIFVADGDVSGMASIVPIANLESFYFLTNLDVFGTHAAGAVAALGASITDSSNSTFGANLRWTNLLAKRLNSMPGIRVGVLNEGISGNQLLSDGAGEAAIRRFERDVLSQTDVRWIIFSDDPINDLSSHSDMELPSADQLIGAVQDLITQAHSKGIRFYCSTLTPNGGRSARDWSEAAEQRRQAINRFYRSPSSPCDGLVDLDRALRDPNQLTRFRTQFDSGDHLHPNDAGMAAIANAISLRLFQLGPTPQPARLNK